MTNFIARFAAKWLLWIFGAEREPEPPPDAYGDVPHVPAAAKAMAGKPEKAKGRAA